MPFLLAIVLTLTSPAARWESERFPQGNGSLGVMSDGDTVLGRWQFNVGSLWSGDANPDGSRDDASADANYAKMGTYLAFGEVTAATDFLRCDFAEDYRRELDLERAVQTVTFTCRGVRFTQETFVSHPDQVMAVRLNTDRDAKGVGPSANRIVWRTALNSTRGEPVTTADGDRAFSGTLPNGLKYAARLRTRVIGRDTFLFLAADTDYSLATPDFRRPDGLTDLKARLDAAEAKGWAKLLADHVADYRSLYGRCDILPAFQTSQASQTFQFAQRVRTLFQYGRYLLIASSRKGGVPPNLQGLWNDSNTPIWGSDYHTNINIQMNYWGAEATGLGELHETLVDWLGAIAPTASAETARAFPGSSGYAFRTSLNVFGGGGWKWNLAGAPWLATHAWDHYAFGGDRGYLARTGYPVLKGAAEFALGHLKERADGSLVVPDGWSPEHGPRADGVAHDQQIFSQLFADTAAAAAALGVDADFRARCEDAHRRLAGPKIGRWGQLQEWETDDDVKGDTHRHTSQLYAVYPGNEISPRRTPAFAKAAAVALDGRTMTGDARRSWTWPWRAALWARLGEGEKAWTMLTGVFAKNVMPNGLTTHPPFQIDGNFGYTGAFAECFLQSHEDVVNVLPVVLPGFASGSFRGLCARGGYVVDATWNDGRVTALTVHSALGRAGKVLVNGKTYDIPARKGDFEILSPCAVSFALPNAEFVRYHREITGRDPAPDAVTFAVDPSVSASGKDAYRIKSSGTGVTITGSNLRSVWYGLYDLLERRGGCHWFWDGDVVPKRPSLDLAGLDVKEEAQFEYRGLRYFAHRGLTRFQAEHWGPEDWKREIDWCLKRRLNVFMMRIGQDDLFQRAFPDVCAYPDATKDLPGHGEGYDNRTLFWSLEYRGKLRQRVQRYAFDRGLEVPEDFGTMTHWYSRTPEDFLGKLNPPFLPQATEGYGEKNGLVWDIRDDRWADEYWKLTTTAVEAYGQGRDQKLLHTIGLGERRCFTNRQDNLNLKIESLKKFLARSHRDFPNARNLLAGWDFYFTWHPEEVRELVSHLDPRRDIIWDYEGDSTRDYRPEMKDIGGNDFTKWGVVGKFPYTYSIFLSFEDALDIRANYPLIEKRQKIVQNDPFCAGYIFWPESSHTDTLLLRYFTANAWTRGGVSSESVLDEFCRSRYGADAAKWKAVWERVIPASRLFDWSGNYAKYAVNRDRWMVASEWDGTPANRYNDGAFWAAKTMPEELLPAPDVFRALAARDWKTSVFTERDAIDLARTMADRLISFSHDELVKAYHAWKSGKGPAGDVERRATAFKAMAGAMAELLALHTDYSLAESYDRLDAVEKIRNPNFAKVLVENAVCNYCASHQYEAAEYWYKPSLREFADGLVRRVRADDRSELGPYPTFMEYRDARMYAKPLAGMRPTLPRTQANYVRVLTALANASEAFVER